MGAFILTASILGFVYSAAPGAVNTEAIRRGLKKGFWPSFFVQVGALLGDLVWATVGLTGVALVFHVTPVRIILGFAGVAFLLRMAWNSFVESRTAGDVTRERSMGNERNFTTGLIFSLANPFGIAFWGGVGGGFAAHVAGMPLLDKLWVLFAGFSIGAVVWCVGISALVSWSRKFVSARVLQGIFTMSSLAMAYFALDMLWTLWHTTVEPLFSHRLPAK